MARKPANLIYGLDDRPPPLTLGLLGLQHVFVMTSGWVLVVVIVTAVGGAQDVAADVLRMSMIASGIATIVQSLRDGRFGSGYLCPISSGPAYVSASIVAGKAGGLGAVFTLTLFAGLFQALLAPLLPRLRAMFPPEVTGLIVAMVGVELVAVATPRFLGFQTGGPGADGTVALVATVTLVAMIGPTVWSRGKLRLYPVIIGLAVGYALAFQTGLMSAGALRDAFDASWFSLPRKVDTSWVFRPEYLLAFLIVSLASALKAVGDLTLCQKINDADWKRTELKSVRGGVFAGGLGTFLAGLLGGIGQSTFSSNVGLSAATGATSRVIALPCGLLMITLAFVPKLAAVFSVMPAPVMGAILVYVASYMILAGIEVITSRMLDARRIFVVGIALIFGLSVEMVPGLYAGMPEPVQPLFSSSLAVATVLVVALNLLFRLGTSQRAVLELRPGTDGSEHIARFMETQGGTWGARREVVSRATAALNEFAESAAAQALVDGTVEALMKFDEFRLDIELRYRGAPLALPELRPTSDELLADDRVFAALQGFMIRQYADRVDMELDGEYCRLHLHFEH